MINLFRQKNRLETNELGLSYFKDEIASSEHTYRQGKVNTIQKHLLRQHNVSARAAQSYNFKGKVFTPAAIILQGMKTVVNFHTAYLGTVQK